MVFYEELGLNPVYLVDWFSECYFLSNFNPTTNFKWRW